LQKTAKEHYVDNKKFYESIMEHRKKVAEAEKKGTEPPRMSEYIGECILKIAQRLTYHRYYINYSEHYKEEMISDGIENCIQYFDRFNPEKSKNPFAYFTQIIWFAFRRRIMKEQKLRYTMYKNAEKFMTENGDGELIQMPMYDNIQDFIASYEEREQEKKDKKKNANKS